MSHADFIHTTLSGAGILLKHMKKESKLKEQEAIMEQIIQKGGMVGQCAERYKDDSALSDTFIRECAKECRDQVFYKFWGTELAINIISYAER